MADGLVRRDVLTPSRRPYALLPGTFTRARRDTAGNPLKSAVVDAVWVGRKNGRTIVTKGTLTLFSLTDPADDYDSAVRGADMRYGGSWEAVWDGHSLLVESTHPLSPDEQVAMAAELDAIRNALPVVPANYDGWYYRQTPGGAR